MGGLAPDDRLELAPDHLFPDRIVLETYVNPGAIDLGRAPLGTVRSRYDKLNPGLTVPRARHEPLAATISLLPLSGGEFWCDGRAFHRTRGMAGGFPVAGPPRFCAAGLRNELQRFNGGLAPWQCKRAKEIMLDDLSVSPSLAEIAATCGLSSRHFLRAFKASNGMPPHRWLLKARVERAREMLEKTAESVGEIANACGFADQSHLTRTFRKLFGTPPGAWRRTREARVDPPGPMRGRER